MVELSVTTRNAKGDIQGRGERYTKAAAKRMCQGERATASSMLLFAWSTSINLNEVNSNQVIGI